MRNGSVTLEVTGYYCKHVYSRFLQRLMDQATYYLCSTMKLIRLKLHRLDLLNALHDLTHLVGSRLCLRDQSHAGLTDFHALGSGADQRECGAHEYAAWLADRHRHSSQAQLAGLVVLNDLSHVRLRPAVRRGSPG